MELIRAADSGFVPASHEDPRNPGVLKRVIATAARFQDGHVQMLNWARLPAGSSFRPHYHEDMQEVFVLVSGHVTMTGQNKITGDDRNSIQGFSVEMWPGDTVIVDPREVHQMTNPAETDAEYLVFGISSMQGGKTVLSEM
ncbi:MAG: cupin domain-containing protein [Planctomyces sp.]|nr:cupin domain-containing protein [Planctomyces sp.]